MKETSGLSKQRRMPSDLMEIHEDGTLEIKLSYMDEFAALTKTCEKIRKEVA